jgi:hypothetical protein
MRRYVDQNGDGDINDDDRVIMGNPNPKFTGGFTMNFAYKNWSLDAAFVGVYGTQIVNGNNAVNYSVGWMARSHGNNIASEAYYGAYNAQTNPNGRFPALLSMPQTSTNDFQDWMIEDGSYLRLSNITLTYRFNFKPTSYIRNLDLSVTGRNLWLLTNYSGFDPDVNSFAGEGNGLRRGVDYGSYPNSRGVVFGLNLTF